MARTMVHTNCTLVASPLVRTISASMLDFFVYLYSRQCWLESCICQIKSAFFPTHSFVHSLFLFIIYLVSFIDTHTHSERCTCCIYICYVCLFIIYFTLSQCIPFSFQYCILFLFYFSSIWFGVSMSERERVQLCVRVVFASGIEQGLCSVHG